MIAAIVVLLAAATVGCGGGVPSSIDLVAALPTAERRALTAPDTAIHATVVSRNGIEQPALVTDAPARVIFPVNMPSHARFRTAVALQSAPGTSVTIRMGIADARSYDELVRLIVDAPAAGADRWKPIDVDLHEYSGWQWSLFYHPSRMTWKLVLNADATPGGSVIWLLPTVEMGAR